MSSDWLKDFEEREKVNDKVKVEVSEKILDLLKGVDRVSCLPTILANIFEYIETPAGTDENHGFNNQIVGWGLETYAGRKVTSITKNLLALYNYCVDEEYTEDNQWQWGGGDRCVCYIPNENKKILLFENQNIQFVVVFDGIKVHVREVFKSLMNNDDYSFYSFKGQYFNSVTELREGLKSEKGLEIALCNLTSKYERFSNCVEGNEYPSKIDLDNMKKFDFDKDCSSFRYGDNRDNGYLMSFYNTSMSLDKKCELNDLRRADYAFFDMSGASMEIPKSYLKALKREEAVSKLLNKK